MANPQTRHGAGIGETQKNSLLKLKPYSAGGKETINKIRNKVGSSNMTMV